MSTVLETPERAMVEHDRDAFNLAVWDKILANKEFAAMPYRFETNEHGQVGTMSFFALGGPIGSSAICPNFPQAIE